MASAVKKASSRPLVSRVENLAVSVVPAEPLVPPEVVAVVLVDACFDSLLVLVLCEPSSDVSADASELVDEVVVPVLVELPALVELELVPVLLLVPLVVALVPLPLPVLLAVRDAFTRSFMNALCRARAACTQPLGEFVAGE